MKPALLCALLAAYLGLSEASQNKTRMLQVSRQLANLDEHHHQPTTTTEGARQVQRLARNAQQKLEFLSGRVSQIEARIEDDLSGNSTSSSQTDSFNNQPVDASTSDGLEPTAMVSTGPLSPLVEPTQPSSMGLDDADGSRWQPTSVASSPLDGSDAHSTGNNRSQPRPSWSAPVIKSVFPESIKRATTTNHISQQQPQPSQQDADGNVEETSAGDEDEPLQQQPKKDPEASSSSSSRNFPADSPLAELDLDAPVNRTRYETKPAAWDPNQNHNYFQEMNAKNHNGGHKMGQQEAGKRQAHKFQNMTIMSSDSDLANSYSSHQTERKPAPPQAMAEAKPRSSSVVTYSPYRQQQQQPAGQRNKETTGGELGATASTWEANGTNNIITWPALAGPMQPALPQSYYSIPAAQEGVLYTPTTTTSGGLTAAQALTDYQMPAQASTGGQRLYAAAASNATTDLKHRSSSSSSSHQSELEPSGVYAAASGLQHSDSAYEAASMPSLGEQVAAADAAEQYNRHYGAQDRNMYDSAQGQQQQQHQGQDSQQVSFGPYQPAASQRNDEVHQSQQQQLAETAGSESQSDQQQQQQQTPTVYAAARNSPAHYYQTEQSQQPTEQTATKQQQQQQQLSQLVANLAQQPAGSSGDLMSVLRFFHHQKLLANQQRQQAALAQRQAAQTGSGGNQVGPSADGSYAQQQQPQPQANNPISRASYASNYANYGANYGGDHYRRYSPDSQLAAYLGRAQQQQQQQQSENGDLMPYTTNFQPIYANGATFDSRNLALYRAAMAAANKANEQAASKAINAYLAAAAAAAAVQQQQQQQLQQQQQNQQQQQQAILYAHPGNNYSSQTSLYGPTSAAASAPAYYEGKSADDSVLAGSHLQRVHHSANGAQQPQQLPAAPTTYTSSQGGNGQQNSYKRSYLNSLFKPTASSRYYYAPSLLSPISLAAPATMYTPTLATADALSLPAQMYAAATSPYAVHAPTHTSYADQHYQQALAAAAAAAAAANGLHAHYMTDPDMAESSLVATDASGAHYVAPNDASSVASNSAGDDSSASSTSSGSSSSSNGLQSSSSSSSQSSSGKGGKGGMGPWTNIAGLLLGILPFGILMASILPAVTVAGRKKRELDLGLRNFAELLKWRPPSRVLEALMGARSAHDLANATASFITAASSQHQKKLRMEPDDAQRSRRRSLDALSGSSSGGDAERKPQSQQVTAVEQQQQTADNASGRSLSMGNDLSQAAALTMLAGAVAGGGGSQQQPQSGQTSATTPAAASLAAASTATTSTTTVKAKVRKAISALNSFLSAAQNIKRRHRSASSADSSNGGGGGGQWRLQPLNSIKQKLDNMLNLTDYKRQLAGLVQQRALVALQQQLAAEGKWARQPALSPPVNGATKSSENGLEVAERRQEGPQEARSGHHQLLMNEVVANASARHHLGVCLSQFLCRLTVKLNRSLRNTNSTSSSNSTGDDQSQLERLTKKYIGQLVEQIEAEHPQVSGLSFLGAVDVKNQTQARDEARPPSGGGLDSLYKNAMRNQCSAVYNCHELLQLERTLSKMKLKFS